MATTLALMGTRVERGQPLYIVHAHASGELDYAFDYVQGEPDIVRIETAA